jgi:hypothetical protein
MIPTKTSREMLATGHARPCKLVCANHHQMYAQASEPKRSRR